MKISDRIDKRMLRRSFWTSMLLVLVAAATLEITGLIQYYFARKGLVEEASRRAESEMALTRERIENMLGSVETSAEQLAWITGFVLDQPDSLFALIERLLDTTPEVLSGGLAFKEGYYPSKGHWYEPLVARREGGNYERMVLGSESHDYFLADWYTFPLISGEGQWSEPYFDESGAKTTVVTYSLPIKDPSGNIVGVLGADVSLEWASAMFGDLQLYPDSYSVLRSGDGSVIASSSDTSELVDPMRYTAPIGKVGWNMSVVIPQESVFDGIKRVGQLVMLFQLLGLAMIILIIRSAIRSRLKYADLSEKKERMESELQIAHGIQMAMLPNIFPPFPERNDIDMFAFLDPAKEVGGDLYDFFIRNDKLFFCIGDVSGKGVPASLVMAVTRSLFRTVSAHERSPLHIITAINNSMADINEDTMFVTFFCGILDLLNGHLRYCNAGHNAPLLLGDTVRELPVEPNLPLGIIPGFAYKEQETDLVFGESVFLFTDGITEAENADKKMFGDERLHNVLAKGKGNAREMLDALKAALTKFVGHARQSDDMTTMLIRYMNDKNPDSFERHIILHNDIQQIPQLAGFVEAIAQDAHLDQSLAMSLNLALEEAVTNVIMYAYPKGSDGLVDVEAIIRARSIDFAVIDSGTPFDPTQVPAASINSPVEERPVGGLGIYLVKTIMDTVSYRRYEGKNILSMTKNI